MLVIAGKQSATSNDWPAKEINSGHDNLGLYEVTQPDGRIRHIYAVKLQAVVLPNCQHSPIEAINEMIDHLQFIKEHQYAQSYIVE